MRVAVLILCACLCLPSECEVPERATDLIKRYEGFVPVVYVDPAGHPTVCWGSLLTRAEARALRGRALTPAECERLFQEDLRREAGHVRRAVQVHLTPYQFGALTSWTFNLGVGNLRRSTMLRRINAERHDEVPYQMKRWNRAGGRKLLGLVRRRAAEARLYQRPYPCNSTD
ncbi:MAG: glycoside hydrolase family protein [Bacteroidetes bacterium]|jgi:lysozyme|nr:glycoside hydrolase family protein [Bacteroidota bacterium]